MFTILLIITKVNRTQNASTSKRKCRLEGINNHPSMVFSVMFVEERHFYKTINTPATINQTKGAESISLTIGSGFMTMVKYHNFVR